MRSRFKVLLKEVIFIAQLIVIIGSKSNNTKLLSYNQIRKISFTENCETKICHPKYGDLLLGRHLITDSTCGTIVPEEYCVLLLNHKKQSKLHNFPVKTQFPKINPNKTTNVLTKCNVCDSIKDANNYTIQNIVNNHDPNLWWQSENNKENVSILFNLEDEFLFKKIHIKFKTFIPYAMFLEKSVDFGKTWKNLSYFADNCGKAFPRISEAYCKETYSKKLPFRDKYLVYQINPNFETDIDLYKNSDSMIITNLRIVFTKFFQPNYEIFNEVIPKKQLNKYNYYAVETIQIIGHCHCNGHSPNCSQKNQVVRKNIKHMMHSGCNCQHNTQGPHCDHCMPLYNDKPWAPATLISANACKKCNCNNHAERCVFSDLEFENSGRISGGVCLCLHNTYGKNCEKCKAGYWYDTNVPFTDANACKPCNCDLRGSVSEYCFRNSNNSITLGQCFCKSNVDGRNCDSCKQGFKNLKAGNPDGCDPYE